MYNLQCAWNTKGLCQFCKAWPTIKVTFAKDVLLISRSHVFFQQKIIAKQVKAFIMFVNIRFRWSHTCNFLKSVCPTNLEFHKLQSMLLNVLWEITNFLKGIHALYSWLKTYRVLKRFSLVKMEKLPQNLFKFQIKVNLSHLISHRWQSKKLISKLMITSIGMWKNV